MAVREEQLILLGGLEDFVTLQKVTEEETKGARDERRRVVHRQKEQNA